MVVNRSNSYRGAEAHRHTRLFFLVFFFRRLDTAVVGGLGFGLFHGFLGLSDFLGADFGALLLFLVENLLAAEKLEEGLVGAIALVPAGADDAGVSTVAVAKARSDRVEKFHDGLVGHEIRG